jgi:hypothetical protein
MLPGGIVAAQWKTHLLQSGNEVVESGNGLLQSGNDPVESGNRLATIWKWAAAKWK